VSDASQRNTGARFLPKTLSEVIHPHQEAGQMRNGCAFLAREQYQRQAPPIKRPLRGSWRFSFGPWGHIPWPFFRYRRLAPVRDIVEIPEPAPFAGIKVETVRVSRYRSTFDLAELLESAREELAPFRPEQYKIYLLGAPAGLRRNEIDVLPWTAFRFDEGVIRVETTEHYRPKSHNSEGDVRVDPELMEVFRGYYARRKSEFVIESDLAPLPFDAPCGVYRCPSDMRKLIGWLRSKGVVAKTPLHTLRKQFGSEIHARYGLLAASNSCVMAALQ
jgi:hypothetical protein